MFGRNGSVSFGESQVVNGGLPPGGGGGGGGVGLIVGGIKERRIAVKCLEMEEMLEKQG